MAMMTFMNLIRIFEEILDLHIFLPLRFQCPKSVVQIHQSLTSVNVQVFPPTVCVLQDELREVFREVEARLVQGDPPDPEAVQFEHTPEVAYDRELPGHDEAQRSKKMNSKSLLN